MRRLLICLTLLLLAESAPAEPLTETWMTVLLDGRKVGHTHTVRTVSNDRVTSIQTMELSLERSGIKLGIFSEESSEETLDGKPLGFTTRSKLSGVESIVKGQLRNDGQMDVSTTVGGSSQTKVMPWPQGALLSEGLRLAAVKSGLKSGTSFTDLAFETSSLSSMKMTTGVHGQEWIELPQGRMKLTRLEQDLAIPGAPMHTRAWVDDDQTVYKMVMPIMGFTLTMLACDKACALAENQSADLFEHTLLRAPRALNAGELHQGLKFTVEATQTHESLTFATTDEQNAKRTSGGKTEIRIAPITQADADVAEHKPEAEDFRATDWLQSDAPEIQALAKQAVADETKPSEQMQQLEKFVRGYIRDKNLSVGYASALEVARTREGDCTEHAVLLAALGRARGIATRVVDGLAYTDHYAGMDHVFVPHAWAQAWVGNHWQSFDAALYGFDAGHIALSVGDGDPWRFYAGLSTLGRLRLISVEPLTANKSRRPEPRP